MCLDQESSDNKIPAVEKEGTREGYQFNFMKVATMTHDTFYAYLPFCSVH